MKPTIFEYTISVPGSAIDHMKHVNNVVYLQWVQDIAIKHWEAKTTERIRKQYVWVALDHFIEYKNPAFENDTITLQTWIHNNRGAKSERHTTIINTKTKKVLINAKTTWCLLHKETLRPTRITEEINILSTS
ncbi:thioesterase family protein [Aquimarina addita]|uniref:Thioesterase family protein n=1 Tax=Aquimarina addita TaxID=870485 RepID=A0ABP7XCL6_9FLAO